jgi:hypothetical protein
MPTRTNLFEAIVAAYGGSKPQFYNCADLNNAGPLGTFYADVGHNAFDSTTTMMVEAIWHISKDSADLGYVTIVAEGDMILDQVSTKDILVNKDDC